MNTRFVMEFDFCVGGALGISRNKGHPSRNAFRQCLDPLNNLALLITQRRILSVASDRWVNESAGLSIRTLPNAIPLAPHDVWRQGVGQSFLKRTDLQPAGL